MTMVEERVSRLEGAYEQVDERLGDLTTAVASLRTDMDAKFDAQRAEIAGLRSEVRSEIAALRAEMNNRLNAHLTFMAVGVVTIVGSIFGAAFIS